MLIEYVYSFIWHLRVVHDFALLTQPFFCKKLRFSDILQDFAIWDCNMDLGCREFEI